MSAAHPAPPLCAIVTSMTTFSGASTEVGYAGQDERPQIVIAISPRRCPPGRRWPPPSRRRKGKRPRRRRSSTRALNSSSAIRQRREGLELAGAYRMQWRKYTSLDDGALIQQLVVGIDPGKEIHPSDSEYRRGRVVTSVNAVTPDGTER